VPSDSALIEGVRAGDRRLLAKAITLLESTRADHRQRAAHLLDALLPHSGRSIRIGISGAPGAGKSTLTDLLVLKLRETGGEVGVLAVDPTSPFSGGAILGDRVRMQSHTEDPGV
jgi:LAO/AO transport system kinase